MKKGNLLVNATEKLNLLDILSTHKSREFKKKYNYGDGEIYKYFRQNIS